MSKGGCGQQTEVPARSCSRQLADTFLTLYCHFVRVNFQWIDYINSGEKVEEAPVLLSVQLLGSVCRSQLGCL